VNVAWSQVALAGLWGGVVALERKAFLQAMLSRPLVASTVMGLILSDVASGLFVGMFLELFYLGAANLGASLPENDTLAATGTAAAAACMAQATGSGSTPALWSIAILLFIPLGRAGRVLDRRLEGYSARLAATALSAAEAGHLSRAVRQNLWGMWPHLALFGGVTAACAVVGFGLGPLVERLPLGLLRGLAWAYPALGSVAAAIAARGSNARRAHLWALVGAGVGLLLVGVLTLRGPR
jgi:mannose/fructose/N-acetylgalactosamine-specific phosphotransferase system component IIC